MGLDSEEEEEEEEEDEEEEEKKGLSDDSSDSLSTTTSCERAPLLFIDEANGEDDEMEFVDGDSKIVENKEKLVEEEVKTPTTVNLPLIDYLCAYNNSCSLKELLALFQCVPARRRMLSQLQQHCNLRTAHLRPAQRNVALHAHDFSVHNVDKTFACGGYLSLTVRQYFYAKHNIRLKHAQLPTLIEFGGGTHASYYPLECVHVVLNDGGGRHMSLARGPSKTSSAECRRRVLLAPRTDDVSCPVQNSTATFSLHLLSTVRFTTDQFLALARNASCTEYNPSRFHAIVMRVRQRSVTSNNNNNDKRISDYGRTATALIFRSGRVVLTGVACSPYTLIQEAVYGARGAPN
uniref:PAZ domain-containing protein n=1 Tax=Globodera pallida TaxID=36090 RepID=A0A183CLX5_GLOPA